MSALWIFGKVIVLAATDGALKVPSETSGGSSLLVASMVTVPSTLLTAAPPPIVIETVGVIEAVAL